MADIIPEDEKAIALLTEKPLKRKRIRRLGQNEASEGNSRKRYRHERKNDNTIYKIRRSYRNLLKTCTVIIGLIVMAIFFDNTHEGHMKNLITNIISNYWRNYHQILHNNKNYCDEILDIDTLTAQIHQKQIILHQNKALQEIQLALRSQQNFISVALVGPVGVGKNLYTNALQENFPWPQNIHTYAWNTYVRHDFEKYRNIFLLMDHFSDCGVNLLIIKNLTPDDKEIVENIAKHFKNNSKFKRKRLILFYLFNLNTMLENPAEYSAQHDTLQNLYNTTSINFKAFGKTELKDCIKRELKLNNLTLNQETLEELQNTIDVKRSGCKNVYAKILVFGTKSSHQQILNTDEKVLN